MNIEHVENQVFVKGSLTLEQKKNLTLNKVQESLSYSGLKALPAGCVLATTLYDRVVFFQLLNDVDVVDIGTPKTRRLFVDSGSEVDIRGEYTPLTRGVILSETRLVTYFELETYNRHKVI